MEEGSPLGEKMGELRLTSISPHHDRHDQDEPCNIHSSAIGFVAQEVTHHLTIKCSAAPLAASGDGHDSLETLADRFEVLRPHKRGHQQKVTCHKA